MVSVIVPVYNRESTIEKCINSILSQSYKDLEIILVNDGSSDRSGTICEHYSSIDDRIKYFKIYNSGVAEARNVGLRNAVGEYVTFVDSDDYLDKEYVSILFNAIDNTHNVMAISSYSEIINEKEYLKHQYSSVEYPSDKYINDMLYCRVQGGLCWGKIYRRELIHTLFEKYNYCEDVMFVFNYLFFNSGSISVVSDPLYHYVRHEKSITGGKKASDLIDAILVAEAIYKKCETNNSCHSKAAKAFIVNNSLFAYLQSSKEKSTDADILRNKIKKLVAENRKYVLSDKDATIKTKGACILSSISYGLLTLMYGLV